MTYFMMMLLTIILVSVFFVNASYSDINSGFFDKENSMALRGFWCLVIILVHIPVAYQNTIQDMIGSFAYIGVTFFFMTSGYGLKKMFERNPKSIRLFWRKRLPKLVIPCLTVNLFSILVLPTIKKNIILRFININGWVQWLLICYFVFWLSYRFMKEKYRDIIICILIVLISLGIYYIKQKGYIYGTTWCVEVMGFIWGILLANLQKEMISFVNKKWVRNLAIIGLLSAVSGIFYLKYKMVIFIGDYLLKIFLGFIIIKLLLIFNVRISIQNKVSLAIGKISYEIYLLQWVVIPLINLLPLRNSWIFIYLVLSVTVIMGFIINSIDVFLLNLIWKKEKNYE